MKKQSQSGLSMIELLVALAISTVLVLGATTLFVRSRATYDQNEATARLQETARFAMSVIEPDVRAADYWGLLKGGWQLQGKAEGVDGAVATAAAPVSQQAGATAAPVAANPEALVCGNNFATDTDTPIQGDNDDYQLSATIGAGCNTLPLDAAAPGLTWTTAAMASSDTLTVRRAAVCSADPNNNGDLTDSTCPVQQAGRLQICSTRNSAVLFSDGLTPCANWPAAQLSNLSVTTYYIDTNSDQAGLPALRRKVLTSAGGAVRFEDQEIIPGVEDFQVQFGIQPNFANSPVAGTATATSYVNPGDPRLVGGQIVAVRIWLLLRSDAPEPGFVDNRIYEYANRLQATGITGDLNSAGARGRAYQPSQSADASFTGPQRYRRLLVSRTIQIRNATGT